MAYSCRILADSTAFGHRLTTMEVTFPRIVLAEFNTHRVFSRNSASSRAIPIEKQIAKLEEDPFVPEYWGQNQKGMQADQQISPASISVVKNSYLDAMYFNIMVARQMMAQGVHKQTVNRLLEPFMWQTVIVSSTEWENFFKLRCHPDAQPEIRTIALMMRDALAESTPVELEVDDWHMPLIYEEDLTSGYDVRKLSAARCARVSYLTHDGKVDRDADIRLYDRLTSGGHWSPLEHVAVVEEYPFPGNFRYPWTSLRSLAEQEDIDEYHHTGHMPTTQRKEMSSAVMESPVKSETSVKSYEYRIEVQMDDIWVAWHTDIDSREEARRIKRSYEEDSDSRYRIARIPSDAWEVIR